MVFIYLLLQASTLGDLKIGLLAWSYTQRFAATRRAGVLSQNLV